MCVITNSTSIFTVFLNVLDIYIFQKKLFVPLTIEKKVVGRFDGHHAVCDSKYDIEMTLVDPRGEKYFFLCVLIIFVSKKGLNTY